MFFQKKNLSTWLSRGLLPLLVLTTVPVTAPQADILSAIARCESQGRQFDVRGRVLRNPINKNVVGIFQINERYHGPTARRLGLDIYKAKDNLAFAQYLLKTQGTAPWNASRNCWGRRVAQK